MAHMPGIDVFMPSTAADAAGMLNAAFESERPTLFLYPKAMLNDPESDATPMSTQQFVPIGPARKVRAGRDITFVGLGQHGARSASGRRDALERAGVDAEVIDLRSLSPWDERTVARVGRKDGAPDRRPRRQSHLRLRRRSRRDGRRKGPRARRLRRIDSARHVCAVPLWQPDRTAAVLQATGRPRRPNCWTSTVLDAPRGKRRAAMSPSSMRSAPVRRTTGGNRGELLSNRAMPSRRGDAVASVEASKSVFDMTSDGAGGTVLELSGRRRRQRSRSANRLRRMCRRRSTTPEPITQDGRELPSWSPNPSRDV